MGPPEFDIGLSTTYLIYGQAMARNVFCAPAPSNILRHSCHYILYPAGDSGCQHECVNQPMESQQDRILSALFHISISHLYSSRFLSGHLRVSNTYIRTQS